jgi:hypothetical protein
MRFIVTRYDKSMVKKRPNSVRGRPRTGSALSAAERMRRMRATELPAELRKLVKARMERDFRK